MFDIQMNKPWLGDVSKVWPQYLRSLGGSPCHMMAFQAPACCGQGGLLTGTALNPDEYLNCDLKAGVHSKPPARGASPLEKKVRSHMKTFQKSPDRVQKYFRHPRIAYAA